MKIQKLSWAGIKIQTHERIILVDAVENFSASPAFSSAGKNSFSFSASVQADVAVVTHLHFDHFDPKALDASLKEDGYILCANFLEKEVRKRCAHPVVGVGLYQRHHSRDAVLTPVPAMDGIGDQQVSWIIEDATHRVFHGGDTIWHNQFWAIGKQYTSFDLVFLPVNGVVVHFPDLPFSPVPASLTPLEAIAAARLMGAKKLVPIHYGLHIPGVYEEYPQVTECLHTYSATQQMPLLIMNTAEEVTL